MSAWPADLPLDRLSAAIVSVVACATPTAWPAACAAWLVLCAISWIDAPISSAPADTVCALADTCSAATTAATTDGLVAVLLLGAGSVSRAVRGRPACPLALGGECFAIVELLLRRWAPRG